MENVIATAEKLSDGSLVYNVRVLSVKIACVDKEHAEKLEALLSEAVSIEDDKFTL